MFEEVLGMPADLNFLIVDDIESIRKFPVDELKKVGFKGRLLEASSGNEAFETLSKHYETELQVDFIISDYMMKDGTGYEFLQKVRSDSRFSNLPFLLLTTESEKGLVMNCIKAGVSNYLLKPWLPEDLHQKLIFCWKKHLFA